MALFNRLLFPGRKTSSSSSSKCQQPHGIVNHNDNNARRTTAFDPEHVRVVLFRECDFRGRKLLFDSETVQKISVDQTKPDQKFVEVTNGFAYFVMSDGQISDYEQLSEMIFGSIAMSFKGTYLKIHSLTSPYRLMFTQVFPSPNRRMHKSSSTSSNQSSSFEHSTSDQLSDRSTASDTLLVCRRLHGRDCSMDMPMPLSASLSRNSLVVDSGCASHSFSSFSSGPLNCFTWENTVFSSKDLSTIASPSNSATFKRFLRSTTRSLQSISISLPNSSEGLHRNHPHKQSKLGLALIIKIPQECEKCLTQFFMEHVSLLEALIWRTRNVIEHAYLRPASFMSLVMEATEGVSEWLTNLLATPTVKNLWLSRLRVDCDSSFSVIQRKNVNSRGKRTLNLFFKTENSGVKNSIYGPEQFLKDFCELLHCFDVKETNFFISTLLTAVLTHHLGWVATVNVSCEHVCENFNGQPFNALWSQLADLYGAVGHPVKTAQTIITGSNNKNKIIDKLLNCLTYFIRFSDVTKVNVARPSAEEENRRASLICAKNHCIPKENYKKYEDHLRELLPQETNKRLNKVKSCTRLVKYLSRESEDVKKTIESDNSKVLFVLGDNDALVGLKKEENDDEIEKSQSKSGAKRKISVIKKSTMHLHNSSSFETLYKERLPSSVGGQISSRAQSEPPPNNPPPKYSRVKFNLQQYPQVVTNYLKGKNIELEGLSLGEKVFDKFATVQHNIKLDLSGYQSDTEEVEALQTPSNASELEFSPDMGEDSCQKEELNLQIVNIPMPKSFKFPCSSDSSVPYCESIVKGIMDTYVPDMVLQGTTRPKDQWEWKLKNNLSVGSQHSLLDQPIEEAVAILANTDSWEVQLMSSHTYVIDKSANGVRAVTSHLVANMLESLLEMWRANIPVRYCLLHIEQRLQEVCLRSRALAQILLASEEFFSIDSLRSILKVEISDVPLLMAVASTHTPEVTSKYGISFQ
ncbi:hypothetical protein ABEB36_011859 [Hypothenemus hampei]|uniref:UDENN FNIP1/2-type domain-containing protein n=1 Tax=Hypothenemus hampei TaxID=57062 RepID=A0ABD1EDK9_HYPHA